MMSSGHPPTVCAQHEELLASDSSSADSCLLLFFLAPFTFQRAFAKLLFTYFKLKSSFVPLWPLVTYKDILCVRLMSV